MRSCLLAAGLITGHLIVSSAVAEPFKPIGMPISEMGKARFTVIGADRKKKSTVVKLDRLQSFEEQTIETLSRDGKQYFEIKEHMKLFNGQHVETSSLVEAGKILKQISFHLLRRSPGGEVLEKWEFRFDDPSWNYPDDVYAAPAVSLVFRSLIHQGMDEGSIHVWINDQGVIRMILKKMGKETIKVPLGEFVCHRIRMVPDVQSVLPVGKFLALLIQPFMPELDFWLWEKPPYPIVRAEGALGPPGSPSMLMEVIEGREGAVDGSSGFPLGAHLEQGNPPVCPRIGSGVRPGGHQSSGRE